MIFRRAKAFLKKPFVKPYIFTKNHTNRTIFCFKTVQFLEKNVQNHAIFKKTVHFLEKTEQLIILFIFYHKSVHFEHFIIFKHRLLS